MSADSLPSAAGAYRGADRQRQVRARARRWRADAEGVDHHADSAQVIGDLRIISARPRRGGSPRRRPSTASNGRRLLGGRLGAEAQVEIEGRPRRGRLPILVGGTGLYLRTLLQGIAPGPRHRPRAPRASAPCPWPRLTRAEPGGSGSRRPPAPHRHHRVARALEVVRATGSRSAMAAGANAAASANACRCAPCSCSPRASGSTRAATRASTR
jgi:tRNA dimethylallyltransferase